jgi:hypothetical protein
MKREIGLKEEGTSIDVPSFVRGRRQMSNYWKCDFRIIYNR